MKEVTLQEARALLGACRAVIIDLNVLVYPALAHLTGQDDHVFLYLQDDGTNTELKFSEGRNQKVKLVESSMFLMADDAEEDTQLTLLQPQNLEDAKAN